MYGERIMRLPVLGQQAIFAMILALEALMPIRLEDPQ
jgi:hypothetical protein